MTSILDVVNLALLEMGNRVEINSLNDGTPAANAASRLYTPKTQALLRSAPWAFARKQVLLTQYKAAVINGETSSDPPPQPWSYEYLRPADCLRARFLIPYYTTAAGGTPLTTAPNVSFPPASANTGIPFVDAVDTDSNGNPIQVILTQLPQAQLVYTMDLSQFPQMWDAMFQSAETAYLASYFVAALTGDRDLMAQQIGIASRLLDAARGASNNEAINSQDHIPDWMRARAAGFYNPAPWSAAFGGSAYNAGWDACSFPNGLTY